jgi:hypothetical protein
LSYGEGLAGKPLTDAGFFGVVHGICGDMAWMAERLRLPNFTPNAARPCALCACDRDERPFKDLRAAAAWQETCVVAPAGRPSTSPVWDVPGVNLFTLRLDLMHVCDLGVIPHFVGSCFWSFIYNGEVAGASIDARTRNLWARIKELYTEHRSNCRISRLDVSFFCNASRPRAEFPFLKGKAAENRQLLPVVLSLCEEFSRGTQRDLARVQCAQSLLGFVRVCSRAGVVLSAAECEEAQRTLQTGMDAYMVLSFLAATVERQLLFNIVNKHHFMMHIGAAAKHVNPEAVWAYQWEDLVGRAQKVAMSTKPGTRSTGIPASFIRRYRRVLHISLR